MRSILKIAVAGALIVAAASIKAEAATDAQPITAPVSGMLTNMSQLTPGGGENAASLRYVNPSVKWRSYTKLIIMPVTFWGPDADLDTATQQIMCDYLFNKLNEALSKQIQIVTTPGPNTLVLKVGLTDLTASTGGLRTVSVVVPQARLLSMGSKMITGKTAFAGAAQGEGELTDSLTGVRLAAFVDRRQADSSITNAASVKWGDAESVMNAWVEITQKRLTALQTGR